MRGLSCERIQCDEIWSFCYAKDKNVPEELRGMFGFGDIWTWTAIGSSSLHVLQFLPDSSEFESNSDYGRRGYRSSLGDWGYCKVIEITILLLFNIYLGNVAIAISPDKFVTNHLR